jgi:hypothetical protein
VHGAARLLFIAVSGKLAVAAQYPKLLVPGFHEQDGFAVVAALAIRGFLKFRCFASNRLSQ